MGLRINQNIAAMNSYRNLSVTDGQMSKSLEKLSSGYRINRAADDAAGLSVSEGLRAQVGGLKVAVRNAQDGISVVQTAEGALTEVHSILQRMRDLAVQASNSGSQDLSARTAAQTEFDQLNDELDRIGTTTRFGNQKLLDGTFGVKNATVNGALAATTYTTLAADDLTLTVTGGAAAGALTVNLDAQTGVTGTVMASHIESRIKAAFLGGSAAQAAVADSVKVTASSDGTNSTLTIEIGKLGTGSTFTLANSGGTFLTKTGLPGTASTAQAGTGGTFQVGANQTEDITVGISKVDSTALGTDVLDLKASASAAITSLDTAISAISTQRATLGAFQNRFEHTINNLNVAVENLSASESRIRDTDMAQEMVAFTRSQILSQAGTAMLGQANQAPQSVLQLLRG